MKAILQIAAEVRKELLEVYDMPRGNCLPFSKNLRHALIKEGYDAKIVQGKFKIDDPINTFYEDGSEIPDKVKFNPLHYWLEVDKKILDISADQFDCELDGETMEPILFGTYKDFPRYKAIRKGWE